MLLRKLWIILGLAASPLAAQTADSASAPADTATLSWTDSALNSLYFLSQGLDREIVVCGLGTESVVETIMMLPLHASEPDNVSLKTSCPDSALVTWHNHPWTGPSEADGYTKPAGLCYLGAQDVQGALRSNTPWVAVSVGRADEWSYLCWWKVSTLTLGQWAASIPEQRRKYRSE